MDWYKFIISFEFLSIMLIYHHCMSLEDVIFGEIKANPLKSDQYFRGAYLWLQKEVGYFPLFVAVGTTYEAIRMTGYPEQWRKIVGSEVIGRRKNGTFIQRYILRDNFPNYVLFSFEKLDGIFMDYDYWHLVLNAENRDYQITDHEKRLIFKPSWSKSRWLRRAREEPQDVQMTTPTLNLPDASRTWVKNNHTKKTLEQMGFNCVEVKRMPCDKLPMLN